MDAQAAVVVPQPEGRPGGRDTPTRTPERAEAGAIVDLDLEPDLLSDLHDCFGMMYAGSEWDSDDEVGGRAGGGFGLRKRHI